MRVPQSTDNATTVQSTYSVCMHLERSTSAIHTHLYCPWENILKNDDNDHHKEEYHVHIKKLGGNLLNINCKFG